MKALYFDRTLKPVNIPVPERKPGEALIRVLYAGICQTDIEITKGYMKFKGIPGHEFVGIVEESEKQNLTGKRVVGEINIGCGKCPYCLNNDPRHCRDRTVLGIHNKDGTFAEFITLPENNLFNVPENISDKEAVFTEPLAASLEIVEQIKISPCNNVAILGDGKLGLLISQVIKLHCPDMMLYGLNKKKLDVAEKLGIPVSIWNGKEKEKYDIVVECSGSPEGLHNSLNIVKPRGTIVLKSTYNTEPKIDVSKIVVNEITIVGSRCGRFEPAIRLLESKLINVNSIIDRIFDLGEGVNAFRYINDQSPLKILLKVNET